MKHIISSERNPFKLDLSELYSYKDLFLILAYRDVKVRYAQTFLGILWALIQPLVTLIIFSVIFGMAIKVDTGKIPYPLFALVGLSGWSYFASVLTQCGSSIIGSQEMIKKIYFPRLIIPLSKATVSLIDFFVTLVFIGVLLIYYQITPSANIIYLPVFILLIIIVSLAVGIWINALTVKYRDFQHVIPFIVQIGLYITPIVYPSSILSEKFKFFLYFNPMAGLIEAFRWSVFGGTFPMDLFLISAFVALLLFVTSLFYFKKVEDVIADII